MNGAETVIRTAAACGVEVCFANPGTTEMPLVAALDAVPEMRAVLGLHENVCTAAADGFARMTRRPAATLLHLGPGLANGLANLHNARRARSPVVNLVGDHASWHLDADPPLAMDVHAVAGSVSAWVRRSESAGALGEDTAEAVAAALGGNGHVATLMLPHDFQIEETAGPALARNPVPAPEPGSHAVESAAAALRKPGRNALLVGGAGMYGHGMALAGRIAAGTGCSLIHERAITRLDSGHGCPAIEPLPYFPELAQALLDRYDRVVLAGARSPVSFFGYPDQPSRYLAGRDEVFVLASEEENVVAGLAALADALDAPARYVAADPPLPEMPEGRLHPDSLCAVLARAQPEDAVVVATAVTISLAYTRLAQSAAPCTQLGVTGGAIGQGPATAIGCAMACPGQRVINLQADGSAAYIPQALWTQARESLDVTTIICANRSYRILGMEMERADLAPGPRARSMMDLTDPPIDWVSIAKGFGVPGTRVETCDELDRALRRALAEPGPALIEALI